MPPGPSAGDSPARPAGSDAAGAPGPDTALPGEQHPDTAQPSVDGNAGRGPLGAPLDEPMWGGGGHGGGMVDDQSVPAGAGADEGVPAWLEEAPVQGYVVARFMLPGAHGGVLALEEDSGSALEAERLIAGVSYDAVVSAFRVRPALCNVLCCMLRI